MPVNLYNTTTIDPIQQKRTSINRIFFEGLGNFIRVFCTCSIILSLIQCVVDIFIFVMLPRGIVTAESGLARKGAPRLSTGGVHTTPFC